MAGLLEGLKVISMELMEAAPAASVWLADWGAEVVKIEPLSGDQFRAMPPPSTGTAASLNTPLNPRFELLNRNKKSLAVDLKQAEGRDIVYRLVKGCDVFISNNELTALDRLKMDYDTIRQVKPSIIYAFVNAYGTEGPDKDGPGYDRVSAWARAGFQYAIGEPGATPPSQRSGMMDRTVAPHLVAGILAALLHRDRTGEGQKLGISLYHSAAWTLAGDIQMALVGQPLPRDDRSKASNPLWSHYLTLDGRWLCLGMLRPEAYWSPFCQAIERPDIENDPRFSDSAGRRKNCELLVRILDSVFASKTIDEWETRCRRHGLIYSRVQSPTEVTQDPQALVNGFFADLPTTAGSMKTVASPVRFYQNPASVVSAAPAIGEHTAEILHSLGFSPADLAKLRLKRVIL